MQIAIMGCGAMGSVYAGLLSDGGNEVMVIDRWETHVAVINAHGLHLEGASGDRRVRVRAFTTPPTETVDLLVIAVKASEARDDDDDARPMIGPETLVITIQNGLGSAEAVAKEIGADRLVVGIAGGFGAALRGPGHAHHNGMQMIRLGAYSGLDFTTVERLVTIWQAAGFKVEAARNIAVMQWDKLICNVAYSAPCALSGLTVGQAMDDPEIGPISRAAAIEAWEIARARGIGVAISDPVAHVRAFAARMPEAKPSLLLDHEAGRASEIDVINGAIPVEAAKVGRKAPVNETLTRLVRYREHALGRQAGS